MISQNEIIILDVTDISAQHEIKRVSSNGEDFISQSVVTPDKNFVIIEILKEYPYLIYNNIKL